MNNTILAPPPMSAAALAGPQLLGQFMNWGLMGALSVQVYLYHLFFSDDPLALRLFVYGLLAFEWVQTGLITANAFNAFVYHYGDVNSILAFGNSWFSVPIMCGVVSCSVQCFYARRILVLSQSRVLTGIIVILAFTQCGAAIAGGIMLKNIVTAADQASTTPAIATWLGGSALVDIVIAVTMTFLLLRTKTGLGRSDSMVNKLVRLVVESGSITASVATLDVIFFAGFSDTLYHECPALVLAKLYANMMLASLNNRVFVKGTLHRHVTEVNSISFRSGPTGTQDNTRVQELELYMKPEGASATGGSSTENERSFSQSDVKGSNWRTQTSIA